MIGDDTFPVPSTVGEWLKKLKLDDYEARFNYNGYGNIDRVRVVWELELVTVRYYNLSIWKRIEFHDSSIQI